MPIGPGKYDESCEIARLHTEALAVVLIVLKGKHGSGFSVQSLGRDITEALPELLEGLARDIRSSLAVLDEPAP